MKNRKDGRNETVIEAKKYLRQGLFVVPIPAKKKGPLLKEWQNLRLTESELPQYFKPGDNIGVLLGKPSGQVDVDLDSPVARFLAPHFLPETGRIHGRSSSPLSHWWYEVITNLPSRTFSDPDGTSLVEIRSNLRQTVVPPSVHPSGETIRWESDGRSARVDGSMLKIAVSKLAAAVLLARHWPAKGKRNVTALALAGTLFRAGWSADEVSEFIGWGR